MSQCLWVCTLGLAGLASLIEGVRIGDVDKNDVTTTASPEEPDYIFKKESAVLKTLEISKKLRGHDQDTNALEMACMAATPSMGTMKFPCKLKTVMAATRNIFNVTGDIVEAGVAEGGGILPILFYLGCTGDLKNRKIHLFDTWEGLDPTDEDKDKGSDFEKGKYKKTLNEFEENLEHFGKLYDAAVGRNQMNQRSISDWNSVTTEHVKVYKGLFADTMPASLEQTQVALLMCDGDMYSSTMDCMKAAGDNVVANGIIYNDDYFNMEGNYRAVQDYLKKNDISKSDTFIVATAEPCAVMHDTDCRKPVSPKTGKCGPDDTPFEAGVFRINAK